MVDAALTGDLANVVARARDLAAHGSTRDAVELLTAENRAHRDPALELELLRLRRIGAEGRATPTTAPLHHIEPQPHDGSLREVAAADLDAEAVRDGIARSGCLLVRGLVPPESVERMVRGIDATYDAFDRSMEGEEVDRSCFSPFHLPDRRDSALPQKVRRKFMRQDGGIVTVDSPHMVFELFEVIDGRGIGDVMTAVLGERPVLSANKCTLRRVEPMEVHGGWHQDGAFLGDQVGSFNVWLALSDCGRRAAGLDLVPKRFDRVLPNDEDAQFDWSLSEGAVRRAAEDTAIVRPEFHAGDALLFDHRLVHRTAADASMTETRYAIEAWFFAPSAYPDDGTTPILY